VLSVNRSLGYAGLCEYDLRDEPTGTMGLGEGPTGGSLRYDSLKPAGEAFSQTDHELEDILGKRGLDLANATIAKRLMEYLPY
jgi:hypothetical protein